MAVAKAKLRSSDDVYRRLKFAVEWDYDSPFHGDGENIWIGYQDGIHGPMEQRLTAFVPIEAGGDLPMHCIQYFRCQDRVLWDRSRRLDELWRSGETPAIHASLAGQRVPGFDAAADERAAQGTQAAIAQAAATMAANEEERQMKLAEKQRRKERQLARRQKEKEARERAVVAGQHIAPDAQPVQVRVWRNMPVAQPLPHAGLRIITWNALCDAYMEEYPPSARPASRAPKLAAAIQEGAADIVAMQEATLCMVEALDAAWVGPCWRTDEPGELVIWSRYPISKAMRVSLGSNTSKYALVAEVIVQRRSVAIACVHFTSDRKGGEVVDSSGKRSEQAGLVRAALASFMRHADCFVCGDFNEGQSVEGGGAASACMAGLSDAWPAVHGPAVAGHTFDPTQSALAALGSVDPAPRRLDRIFASPTWHAETAALLGVGEEHSDHYGLACDFVLRSTVVATPVNTSTATLLPPESCWPPIDAIRQRFDPSFGRWMPHLNLIYGFVPVEHFVDAALLSEAVTRRHEPIEVRLERFEVFEHGKSASLVLLPICTPAAGIEALQRDLISLFPACEAAMPRGRGVSFQPHLTVGKFDSAEEARHWKAELEQHWSPLVFVVQEVSLISRPSEGGPFAVRERLPLGSALSQEDAALLEALEAKSGGARAFAIGSAAILGGRRPASSDLDVSIVGPKGREEVFQTLERSMGAAWSRRAKDFLQMEVGGVHLDIQYACCSRHDHPIFWPDLGCCEGAHDVAALRDVHALRAAVLQAHGIFGWQVYQAALLNVKKWTKQRCISSNALGYLGGWSWSLLLAKALLVQADGSFTPVPGNAVKAEARDLVKAMQRRFANWQWPQPVILPGAPAPEEDSGASDGLMPIFCPTEPFANSARNVTASTFAVLVEELRQAAYGDASPPPMGQFDHFIRCEVQADAPVHALCAAWLEARMLGLVRSLGQVPSRAAKMAPGLWVLGARANPDVLGRAAEEFRDRLLRDDKDGEWEGLIEVQLEGREAMRRIRRGRAASARATTPPGEDA